jgi:hypothetical protein
MNDTAKQLWEFTGEMAIFRQSAVVLFSLRLRRPSAAGIERWNEQQKLAFCACH